MLVPKKLTVSMVYLLRKYAVDLEQGRRHGHWLAASIYLCKEQNGSFITVPRRTMILYLKCLETPFIDLIQGKLNNPRPLQKVNRFARVRNCE